MVNFIQTPLSNETRDAVLNQPGTGADFIRPVVEQASNYMSGFTIAGTLLVFGCIFFALLGFFLIHFYYGQPMKVASREGKLIQHFDTPKSASMKNAIITGGGMRYENLKDGTLSVTTKSIVNIEGKSAIITFAGYGMSIPIPHLAAMTILANEGIKLNMVRDEETGEYVKTLNKNLSLDTVVLSGYNFDNFTEMLKQMKNKNYIPLMIESVENFITNNVSAVFVESQIKYTNLINTHNNKDSTNWQMLIYAVVGFLMVLFTYMIVK